MVGDLHPLLRFNAKKLTKGAIYALILLTLLHSCFSPIPLSRSASPSVSPPPIFGSRARKRCNYGDGEWVREEKGPMYNETSCSTIIKGGQKCMANGRPDTGYLHWRWRLRGCQLHRFDASAFLSLIADKHLAFVGDSMARNQLESLLCLLSTFSKPTLTYHDGGGGGGEENKFRRWSFPEHGANVSIFWSPFLVHGVEKSVSLGLDHNKLYVDAADERWSVEIDGIDVVVFSAGHWFLHPAVYYESGGEKQLGCHHCQEKNQSETGFFGMFRRAIKTSLAEVKRRPKTAMAVVVTFSRAHFQGEWDDAGACPRTEPYKAGEKEKEYTEEVMRKIVVEEVKVAGEGGGGWRMEVLDVTEMAAMRADAHPGPYMYKDPFKDGVEKERVQNDCVHWCLPGAIDAWNEVLLETIRAWREESSQR